MWWPENFTSFTGVLCIYEYVYLLFVLYVGVERSQNSKKRKREDDADLGAQYRSKVCLVGVFLLPC